MNVVSSHWKCYPLSKLYRHDHCSAMSARRNHWLRIETMFADWTLALVSDERTVPLVVEGHDGSSEQ